jgi:hypothetical protein
VSGNSYPGGSLALDRYGGYNSRVDGGWNWTAGAWGCVCPGANVDRCVVPTKTFAGGRNAGASVAGANNDCVRRPPAGGLSLADGDTRAVDRTAFIGQPRRTFRAPRRAPFSGAATPRAARAPAAAGPGTCRRRVR